MKKYVILVCFAFIAGFATKSLVDAYRKPAVRAHLDLAFKPGDKVLTTNYHGEQKIENAVGTVIGVAYEPVWHDHEEIEYLVEFDNDVVPGGHSASGRKASELKLLNK
jgi:hypothetical protein